MDLLEIRKKAREAKEAREQAEPKAASQSPESPLQQPGSAAGKAAGRRVSRKKKASRGKTADAGAAVVQPEEGPPVLVEGPGTGIVSDAVPAPPPDVEAAREASPAPSAGPEERPAAPPSAEAAPASFVPPERLELLSFMLAGEEYALKMEEAREIIRWRRPTKVPRAPEHIIGIISLRGVILPVFDIKKRLGLGELEPSRRTRIVVVSDGGSSLSGMVVDRITGVSSMSREGIEPPPSVIGGNEAEFIEGVGRADDGGKRLLILIKTSKALST